MLVDAFLLHVICKERFPANVRVKPVTNSHHGDVTAMG